MEGRLIVIGDVHGCIVELERLIDSVAPGRNDRILFLGDLVNRGPDSHAVVRLARGLKARSLLGNHEARLLRFLKGGDETLLKRYDYPTLEELDDDDIDYLKTMELTVEEPELGMVFVHGGFLPGVPWRNQPAEVVTKIQVIDAQGNPAKRSEAPEGSPHWSERWQGPPFVVYGHTPLPAVKLTDWALGLDTGCVYGGKLSVWILPERRLVQVDAVSPYVGNKPVLHNHVLRRRIVRAEA